MKVVLNCLVYYKAKPLHTFEYRKAEKSRNNSYSEMNAIHHHKRQKKDQEHHDRRN